MHAYTTHTHTHTRARASTPSKHTPDEEEDVEKDDCDNHVKHLLHLLTDEVVRVVPRHELRDSQYHATLRHLQLVADVEG